MLSYEETQEALNQLIDALPPGIFKGLNCGVALLPDTVYGDNGLLILGQYNVEPHGLGRYVTIHYGSLFAIYGYMDAQGFTEKLKDVLHHELTHHLEHLAGDRTLEIKDAQDVRKMLSNRWHDI